MVGNRKVIHPVENLFQLSLKAVLEQVEEKWKENHLTQVHLENGRKNSDDDVCCQFAFHC